MAQMRAGILARFGAVALLAGLLAGSLHAQEAAPPASQDLPAPKVYLEDVMTADEIYLELVATPEIPDEGLGAPKSHVPGEPYVLPTDAAGLPVAPAARIRELVPTDIYPLFDMYLYVNKGVSGLWAQQMFVYEKTETGDLALQHRWLASTGRERMERNFTETPLGLYRLDKDRFFPSAYSYQWDGVSMPWAMFFDYAYPHRMSGYAIHAAIPRYQRNLGLRASAGCIRLYLNHAHDLFKRVEADFAGPMPEFPFDHEAGNTARDGSVVRDEDGAIVMKDGYRVLVVIDDKVVRG